MIMSLNDIDFGRLRDIFIYDPQAPLIFSSGMALCCIHGNICFVATQKYGTYFIRGTVLLLFLLQE